MTGMVLLCVKITAFVKLILNTRTALSSHVAGDLHKIDTEQPISLCIQADNEYAYCISKCPWERQTSKCARQTILETELLAHFLCWRWVSPNKVRFRCPNKIRSFDSCFQAFWSVFFIFHYHHPYILILIIKAPTFPISSAIKCLENGKKCSHKISDKNPLSMNNPEN